MCPCVRLRHLKRLRLRDSPTPEETIPSVAPIQTPPGAEKPAQPTDADSRTELRPNAPTDASVDAQDGEEQDSGGRKLPPTLRGRRGGVRYADLDTHELITLLDEVDDERSRARFREAIYISVIFWLAMVLVLIYGPRYLWHPPVIVQATPDKHQATMTYLDTPPDLKRFAHKPAPAISKQDTQAASPKPSPQVPQPKAGTPNPPAQKPTPQPQQAAPAQQPPPPQQTQAKSTPPTPVPAHPQPPLADAPSAQPRNNSFNTPQSAADAIQQATRGSRGGEGGDYGSSPRSQAGGNLKYPEILSDTQGVDFGKYLARLLGDVKRNWMPLIPEECRPPLNKQGITGVRFTILPNGQITGMKLDYSTHDVAIDRAAWGSILALGQAQPLPKEFHGPDLELRIEFRINKDGQISQ